MIGTADLQNFFVRFVLPPVGCIAAAFATVYIISEINPMGAALLCASMIFFAIAVVAPRIGLFALIVLCGYSDLLKRLLIFWSELTFEQLSYVLIAAPLVVSGLIVAFVTRWAFHKIRVTRRDFVMALLVVASIGLSFIIEWKVSKELLGSAKAAVNSGLYVALMPVLAQFISGEREIVKFLRIATVVFLPVGIYGIFQAIFGFADFEIEYMRTGLTITANEASPRPFSTLNSAGALGDMAALMGIVSLLPYVSDRDRQFPVKALFFPLLFLAGYFSLVATSVIPFSTLVFAIGLAVSLLPFIVMSGEGMSIGRRVAPVLLFTLFSAACIFSLVRHSYFLLLASLVGLICFRSVWRTRIFYTTGIILAVTLVFSSAYLLENIAAWDPGAKAESEFGGRALGIQTYADRLRGFVNLTSSLDMYSPFGLSNDMKASPTTYHHDPISGLLVDYGIFAVLAVLTGFVWALRTAHLRVLELPHGSARLLAVMLLSMIISLLATHALFFGVITTFPVNAFFWMFCGMLVCIITKPQEEAPADAEGPVWKPAVEARWRNAPPAPRGSGAASPRPTWVR